MAHFAVTAVGRDRPGIVAAVTRVLVEEGCNLEDTSMTILRGHFAMMLVVAGPPAGLAAEDLHRALQPVADGLDLVVTVRALQDTVPVSPAGSPWTVSVHGADRPGIVHRTTQALADAGANVVDLTTHLVGDDEQPVYAMVLGVTVPSSVDGEELARRLSELASELGVDCTMRRADPDIL